MPELLDLDIVMQYRHGELYVFAVAPGYHALEFQTFGRFAADSRLSFDWQDASEACHHLRRLMELPNANP